MSEKLKWQKKKSSSVLCVHFLPLWNTKDTKPTRAHLKINCVSILHFLATSQTMEKSYNHQKWTGLTNYFSFSCAPESEERFCMWSYSVTILGLSHCKGILSNSAVKLTQGSTIGPYLLQWWGKNEGTTEQQAASTA